MPKDEEKTKDPNEEGLTKKARMLRAAKKIREAQQKVEEAATIKNTKVREGKHSLAGTRFLKGEDVRSFRPVRKSKPAQKPETTQEKERRTYISSAGSSTPLSFVEWTKKYGYGKTPATLKMHRAYVKNFGKAK